jgi:hypothetical protein
MTNTEIPTSIVTPTNLALAGFRVATATTPSDPGSPASDMTPGEWLDIHTDGDHASCILDGDDEDEFGYNVNDCPFCHTYGYIS